MKGDIRPGQKMALEVGFTLNADEIRGLRDQMPKGTNLREAFQRETRKATEEMLAKFAGAGAALADHENRAELEAEAELIRIRLGEIDRELGDDDED